MLFTKKNFFFIGIKGSGMSALALLLHGNGHSVCGSDVDKYIFTEKRLKEEKIKILPFGCLERNTTKETIVIVGNAFDEKNTDYIKAIKLNLKIVPYIEVLSYMSKQMFSIAITGTHGKTTTTKIMSQLNWDSYPEIFYLVGDGDGGKIEHSTIEVSPESDPIFIFEACEYKRHFLEYNPNISVITNIDFDHPDVFKDILDTKDAFKEMINNTKDAIIINGDDFNIRDISKSINKHKIFSFGFSSDNDVIIYNIREDSNEKNTEFQLKCGQSCLDVKIPLFGEHNILNVTAALSVQLYLQKYIDKHIKLSIDNLKYLNGASRRFQETIIKNAIIIDDYAHHPTEIRVTIEACRKKYPHKNIIAIFQPHSLSRAKTFKLEFENALSLANQFFITEVYMPSNRDNLLEYEDVFNSKYLYSLKKISQIKELKESVILFLSAGNVEEQKTALINLIHN